MLIPIIALLIGALILCFVLLFLPVCFGSVFQPRAARLHGQFQKGGTVRMVEGYRILFHRYPFLKNRQRKTITGFVRFALSDPVSGWTLDLPVSIWTLNLL